MKAEHPQMLLHGDWNYKDNTAQITEEELLTQGEAPF